MALLNSPDMLPEAMRFLVRALLAVGGGPFPRQELLNLVSPPGLSAAMEPLGGAYAHEAVNPAEDDEPDSIEDEDDQTTDTAPGKQRTGGAVIATQSLLALKTLGLVTLEKKQVSLASTASELWSRPIEVTPTAFRAFLLDNVFRLSDPTASPGDRNDVNDLVQAVELVYAADRPLQPFARFISANLERGFRELQVSTFGDDNKLWPVRNETRWTAFCRWSFYLGLTGQAGDSGVIADASIALKIRLGRLPQGVYDAGAFVEHCADAVPLLDGGALQRRFIPELSGATRVLSPALSISLLQMEADGAVKLTQKSDTGVYVVRLHTDQSGDRAFTSVEWLADNEDRRSRA
ncbi:hypothetical protein [Amycolatopsis sp. NPDC051371]|uniref:hypothetical protein n=1 Tax=Amycolatopsis sp. NPDC051371 TaxID=3155800 RepID=UPI00342FCDAD